MPRIAREHDSLGSFQNDDSRTALMGTAQDGYVEVVSALMERMSNEAIAIQNRRDKTALMFASKYGHVEVVRALLERMSDEDIAYQNEDGKTELMIAAALEQFSPYLSLSL